MASPTAASSTDSLPHASIDRLVDHFVASKRSLAASEHVYRANAVVEQARNALEVMVSYNARIQFLRRTIDRHVSTLKAIHWGVERVAVDGEADFKKIVHDLDAINARVTKNLELLNQTVVESRLRPEAEESRSLKDYIDEEPVEGLKAGVHECIDLKQEAQNDLYTSNDAFAQEISSIEAALSVNMTASGRRPDKKETATNFRALEAHATEMAVLLQSLVKHYDLCITALKHTEGGGEAAEKVSIDLPRGVNLDDLTREAPPHPMSDEERIEMLHVIETDAEEVDEVVEEIKGHASELEAEAELWERQLEETRAEHDTLTKSAQLMDELSQTLPTYIEASTRFVERWSQLEERFEDKTAELEGLEDTYDGFLRAYDGLLVESARRKALRTKMEKAAQDAMTKIRKLYNEDIAEREAFTLRYGNYLPKDLWPGVENQPAEFEVNVVGAEHDVLPDIPKDVWMAANQRLKGRPD